MSDHQSYVAKSETRLVDISKPRKKEPTSRIQPTTPERPSRFKQRSSSISGSNRLDDLSPKTPPSSQKLAQLLNQSPTAHNHDTSLPSVTLFNNTNRHHKLSNVPVTPHSVRTHSVRPDLIGENSLLKSPSNFNQKDDDEKPAIRQISSTLKTRLSYAMVKLQNGWSNQSLDELEKSINQEKDTLRPPKDIKVNLLTSPRIKTSKTSPSKVSKFPISPNRRVETPNLKKDYDGSINDGSANAAFLRAMSKSRSPKRNVHHKSLPSLKLDKSSLKPENNPEADAIKTLMSLSSPQSFKPNLASPSHTSVIVPKQKLIFGENLHEAAKTINDGDGSSDYETDVDNETDIEVETEAEESEDEMMRKERKIYEDEDKDLRTAKNLGSP